MNKRKLPKAIQTTTAGFYPAVSTTDASGVGPIPETASTDPGNETVSQRVQKASNVVPISPGAQRASTRIPPVPSGAAVAFVGSDSRQRRRQALTIVNRHAAYSAAGGLIPLPLANFAGVTAIIVRMVKVLSRHYGVSFQRDRARAIVVGLVGGAIPSGAATVTTSALLYVLPPSVLMAAAVSSATAAAFTHSIGRIFIEHFETGATLDEFPPSNTR